MPFIKGMSYNIIINEEVKQKSWDSLNRKNVKAFFIEYGKQNKETIVNITLQMISKLNSRIYWEQWLIFETSRLHIHLTEMIVRKVNDYQRNLRSKIMI